MTVTVWSWHSYRHHILHVQCMYMHVRVHHPWVYYWEMMVLPWSDAIAAKSLFFIFIFFILPLFKGGDYSRRGLVHLVGEHLPGVCTWINCWWQVQLLWLLMLKKPSRDNACFFSQDTRKANFSKPHSSIDFVLIYIGAHAHTEIEVVWNNSSY